MSPHRPRDVRRVATGAAAAAPGGHPTPSTNLTVQ